jgi:hypothetical protein
VSELRPCEASILSVLLSGSRHHFKLPPARRGTIGRLFVRRLVALLPGDNWTITIAGQRAIARHDFERSVLRPHVARQVTAIRH